MKFILMAVMALLMSGCEGFNNYDERTVCTTMSNGDVICTTKYRDSAFNCVTYEDKNQRCDGMGCYYDRRYLHHL